MSQLIRVNRRRLSDALGMAARATSPTKLVEASRCVRIRSVMDYWTVSAFDHQVGFHMKLPKTSDESLPADADVLLHAAKLGEVLRTIQYGYPTVTIDADDEQQGEFIGSYAESGHGGALVPVLEKRSAIRVSAEPGRDDDPRPFWDFPVIAKDDNEGIVGRWVDPPRPGLTLPCEDWASAFGSTRKCQMRLTNAEAQRSFLIDPTVIDVWQGHYCMVAGTTAAINVAGLDLPAGGADHLPLCINPRGADMMWMAVEDQPAGTAELSWTDRAVRMRVSHLDGVGETVVITGRESGKFMPWQQVAARKKAPSIAFALGDLRAAMKSAGCHMGRNCWWLFDPKPGECVVRVAEEIGDLAEKPNARRLQSVGRSAFKTIGNGPLPKQTLFMDRVMAWTDCALPATQVVTMHMDPNTSCRAEAGNLTFLFAPRLG